MKTKKYGYETFSSFQEFETQLALGTVSKETFYEVATDEECPDEFKSILFDTCDDPGVLYYLVRDYKTATEEQLQKIIEKVYNTSGRMFQENLLEGLVERPDLPRSIVMKIFELTSKTPTHWTDIEIALINRHARECIPEVCMQIIKRPDNHKAVLEKALHSLWTNNYLSLKEE